jgi:hypothetical protein
MSAVTLTNGLHQIDKAARASLLYGFDTRDVLRPGDAPQSLELLDVVGVTASQPAVDGTVVFFRAAGGQADQPAQVVLKWTTALGDTDERTLLFRVTRR